MGEGLLDQAGRLIAPFQTRGRTAVVSDDQGRRLCTARITNLLVADDA